MSFLKYRKLERGDYPRWSLIVPLFFLMMRLNELVKKTSH
jgi:hypothetical protein